MGEKIFRVGCGAPAARVFENREDALWGGVRGTSRRTCAGANGRVSEISYNR